MTYLGGYREADDELEGKFDAAIAKCDPKKGWKRAGNKCVRSKNTSPKKKSMGLVGGLVGAAGLGVAAGIGTAVAGTLSSDVSTSHFPNRTSFSSKTKKEDVPPSPGSRQGRTTNQTEGRSANQAGNKNSSRTSASVVKKESSFYEDLGVDEKASSKEIRAKYLELVRRYHPDVNKSPDAEAKIKDLNQKYQKWKDKREKRGDAYLASVAEAENLVCSRLDRSARRRPEKLRCKPGYKQQGAVCKPITKGGLEQPDENDFPGAENSNLPQQRSRGGGGLIAGAVAAGLTAAVAAPPLVMVADVRKNISPKKGEDAPLSPTVKKEDLDKMYDDFTPGDMIQRSFEVAPGTRAWHYAVYTGRNKETGEHEVIDVHTAPKKEGKGERYYVGRRSAMPQDGDSPQNSIYIKVPSEKLSKNPIKDRREILARAEEFAKGEEWNYSLGKNNCEVFARGVIEGTPISRDGSSVSGFTQKMGEVTVDVVNKRMNSNRGLQIPELQERLKKASLEYKKKKIDDLYKRDAKSRKKTDSLRLDQADPSVEDLADYTELFTREPEQTESFKSGDPKRITVKDFSLAIGVVSPSEYQELVREKAATQPLEYQKYIRAAMMRDYTALVTGMSKMLQGANP